MRSAFLKTLAASAIAVLLASGSTANAQIQGSANVSSSPVYSYTPGYGGNNYITYSAPAYSYYTPPVYSTYTPPQNRFSYFTTPYFVPNLTYGDQMATAQPSPANTTFLAPDSGQIAYPGAPNYNIPSFGGVRYPGNVTFSYPAYAGVIHYPGNLNYYFYSPLPFRP